MIRSRYYRDFADVGCTRREDVGIQEPPWQTLKNLTNEEWVRAQNQHYFVNEQTATFGGHGNGFEVVGGRSYSMNWTLVKPQPHGWQEGGKLRMRVTVSCAAPTCGVPMKPMSCHQCRLHAVPDIANAFERVTLNGAILPQSNNVSWLWHSSAAREPFPSEMCAPLRITDLAR